MKPIILLFILSNNSFALDLYTTSLVSVTETTGLDVNNTLLPGSDWVVAHSAAYANGCDDFNLSTGQYYNTNTNMHDSTLYKTVIENSVIDYISASSVCSISATSLSDPTRQAVWSDLGLLRDSSFGMSNINCGTTVCTGVTVNKTYADKVIDTFTPTSGTDGSNASNFNFFLYNYDFLSVNVSNGAAGLGGRADLATPSSVTKYCYIKKDGSTDGVLSAYALAPTLDLKIITWKTISQGPTQPDASLSGSTSGKTTVIKGLDASQLQFLSNDNLRPGL